VCVATPPPNFLRLYVMSCGDRDDRFLRFTTARGDAARDVVVNTKGGRQAGTVKAGVSARKTVHTAAPAYEHSSRYETKNTYSPAVRGRYVPLGFARYTSPIANALDYQYYRVADWRVAIPRTASGPRVKNILQRIFYYGPASAGYVRQGDTLVPALLGVGDRSLVGQSAVGYEAYPLSQ
jgi:hypothetical protein